MKVNEKLKKIQLEFEQILLNFQKETGITITDIKVFPVYELGKDGAISYRINSQIAII